MCARPNAVLIVPAARANHANHSNHSKYLQIRIERSAIQYSNGLEPVHPGKHAQHTTKVLLGALCSKCAEVGRANFLD